MAPSPPPRGEGEGRGGRVGARTKAKVVTIRAQVCDVLSCASATETVCERIVYGIVWRGVSAYRQIKEGVRAEAAPTGFVLLNNKKTFWGKKGGFYRSFSSFCKVANVAFQL